MPGKQENSPVRSFRFSFLAAALVVIAGCNGADAGDDTDESNGALSNSSSDLLAKCPNLEGVEFNAVVDGDPSTLVKQEYTVAGYTNNEGAQVPASRVTTSAAPSSLYGLRFYRENAGKTKFQLSIGTWAGIQNSVEGNNKRLTVSGTTAFSNGSTDSGELVSTSRRDALSAVVGDASKFKFSALDCAGATSISVELPLVTLEKTSNETVDVVGTSGQRFSVSPTVRWTKKADKVTLRFDVPQG